MTYGPPYRASKYSSGEMTATTYSERVKISLRGPLCAGEAYLCAFVTALPVVSPPPSPTNARKLAESGSPKGGGLLRKSFVR